MTSEEWLDLKPGDWLRWASNTRRYSYLYQIRRISHYQPAGCGYPSYEVNPLLIKRTKRWPTTATSPDNYQKYEPSELFLLLYGNNK